MRQPTMLFDGSRYVRIDLNDIVFVKSDDMKCYMFLADGKRYTIPCTLKELLPQLHHDIFIRVHRQYAVNIWRVRMIIGREMYFSSDLKIPIGRTFYSDVLHSFDIISNSHEKSDVVHLQK